MSGDFREIQGTLWFHDHRFFYTAENVYKGFAALLEYFSGPDRGNERIDDGVNLRLPSGWLNQKTWGNRDFDVYLAVQDIALDPAGQLFFDIFNTNGFLGDTMHVNYQVKPTLKVLPRKYRFRILSAGMSRWIKLAIADSLQPNARAVPVQGIANDGNLFPHPVTVEELSIQGTAERLDIIVDFSQGRDPYSQIGKKFYLVNLLEFSNGRGPDKALTLAEALSGRSDDPAVGAILEFEVVGEVQSIDDPTVTLTVANACGANDQSRVPDTLTEQIPIVAPVRERVVDFVRTGNADTEGGFPFDHPADSDPWAIVVNGGAANKLDSRRVSNLIPRPGDIEHWTIRSGNGWGHPVHLHFEEGVTLNRNCKVDPRSIPPTELLQRKDVWRVGRFSGDVQFQVTFGEFGGAYVNHCHNTVHEDNAMLLRYDNNSSTFRKAGDKVHDAGIVYLPTPDPRPEGVTYVEGCGLPEGNMTNIDLGGDECVSGESVGPAVTSPLQDLP
ncbi:MAG: multicopper oxidase domain-containing protein [Candidatus Tectomicrobia bacterium]|uniref:Multicopper oxidase domain-containing protein n=1 Tax=Tectimicrobiota bacterium TaxID=2528274 RepID=A0A932CR81_UNCTE|nr:multicopper oxidase domain-containing protein [Candidatus Tectomicrobia bacterium]